MLLLPSLCFAYGNLQFKDAHTNIVNSVWDERQYNSATFPDGIPWLLNTNALATSALSNVAPSQIQGIVSNAFATWQAVPQTKIRFTFGGITTNKPSGTATNALPPNPALDGDNVVGFGTLPAGVLAQTCLFVLNDQFTFTGANNSFGGTDPDPDIPPGVYPAGTILDADILFATNVAWSVTGERRKYDLQGVLVHEIGHFIGLSHSCVRETYISEATMFPFASLNPEGLGRKVLAQDDITGVGFYYPSSAFSNDFGGIAGTVTKGGTNFLGAHVWAVKTNDRSVIVGTYTGTNGTYSLQGLPPGSYTLRVEPLAGDEDRINEIIAVAYTPSIVDFQAQCYGNVAVETSSAPVAVSASVTTNGYNFALVDGATLDPFEPDNTIAQAHLLVPNGSRAIHHFYPDGDVDFFRFNAISGTVYRISTANITIEHSYGVLNYNSDTILTFYDTDGTTLYLRNDDLAPGNSRYESYILFTCTKSGQYYFSVVDATGNGGGSFIGAGSNYDIELRAVTPAEYYVDGASGSDVTGNGTKAAPWASVQHAIDLAYGTLDTPVFIRVAQGTYLENIGCDDFESIFGGYEAGAWTRDIALHPTILNGRQLGSVVQGANAITIEGLTITNGLASGGGGIVCGYGEPINIVSNNIVGNRATGIGGGVSVAGGASVLFLGNTVSDNTLNGNSQSQGGGVCLGSSTSYIAKNVFKRNSNTGFGGALWTRCLPRFPTEVRDNIFIGNHADGRGGAVHLADDHYAELGKHLIVNNTFAKNNTTTWDGGIGGAISIGDFADSEIRGNLFCANSAGATGISPINPWGGAIYGYRCRATIVENAFVGNYARKFGGALYVDYYVGPSVVGNLFIGNQAAANSPSGSGGAIYDSAYTGSILNNTFVLNKGDGIVLETYSTPTIQNNIICRNQGIGVHETRSGTCFFQNNNIGGNTGGDYYDKNTASTYSTATQINSLVVNPGGAVSNNVDWNPGFIPAPGGTSSSISYNSNTYQSVLSDASAPFTPGALAGLTINPNTNQWPHFYIITNTTTTITTWGDMTAVATSPCPYQVFDYHLAHDSQNINAGTNLTSLITTDIDGEPRPVNGVFDIGADEFYDSDGDGLADNWESRYALNPSNPDSDGDGMNDGWELLYRDPWLVQAGTADPDGDGQTDVAESKAGTDPDDGGSVLKIISILPIGAGYELHWSSVPGKSYQIRTTTNLSESFNPITGATVNATGNITGYTHTPATGGTRFYDIKVLP